MINKMPPRLASICGALILVCLFGAFSFPRTVFESRAKGNQNSSIRYAKQTIWDLSPLPNRNARSRIIPLMRDAELFRGIAQPLHSLFVFLFPSVINRSVVELPPPQSLAVFHPTTRSPPA